MFDDENENFEAEAAESIEGTTVATRRGYAFVSSDEDIPTITEHGVVVTAEQADFLVQESGGKVSITNGEKE